MTDLNENQITNDDVARLINDVMRRSQFAKTEMCRQQGITDNPALLLVAWESKDDDDEHDGAVEYAERVGLSKPFQVGMIPLIHREDVLDSYMEVVKHMPIQKFEYLFMVVEGYMNPTINLNSVDELPADYKRGDMAKDFAENPFTEVREAVIVSGLNWDASEIYTAFSTYKYDDRGVPQFAKLITNQKNIGENDDAEGMGRMMDAMVATTRYMAMAVKAQAFHSLITKPDPSGEAE